jgi:outer membrane protein assembly factor BamB
VRRRRTRLIAVAGAIIVLVVFAVGVVAYLARRPVTKNVRGSPTQEFVTTAARPHVAPPDRPWPLYGYDPARTHAAAYDLRPPFTHLWTFPVWEQMEFPPVLGYGLVFVSQRRGRFFALDAATGRAVWQKHFLHCAAASPAVGRRIVYAAYMQPYPCNRYPRTQRGFVVAMRFANRHGAWINGRILWRYPSGAVESSPLLLGSTLYWGTWTHRLFALDVSNPTRPRLRWTFPADDEIDSSPAYADGRIFFGTNGGHVYALNARTGHKLWRASSFSSFFHGREYFYATPTLAFGRVYIGNTDGTVYAFGQRSGRLLWARHAGSYVYTAAAIWRREVIVGTYDGKLIAYNAATGEEIWHYDAPAAIHGAPAVVGDLVYFSTCGRCGQNGVRHAKAGPRGTYAVSAATGRLVWSFPDGQYSPVVADRRRLYVTGFQHVYAFAPTR